MSLRKYDVPRDNFEWDEADAFSFPCCVCEHKRTRDTEEPCRTCDHNVNAVKDNAEAHGRAVARTVQPLVGDS